MYLHIVLVQLKGEVNLIPRACRFSTRQEFCNRPIAMLKSSQALDTGLVAVWFVGNTGYQRRAWLQVTVQLGIKSCDNMSALTWEKDSLVNGNWMLRNKENRGQNTTNLSISSSFLALRLASIKDRWLYMASKVWTNATVSFSWGERMPLDSSSEA